MTFKYYVMLLLSILIISRGNAKESSSRYHYYEKGDMKFYTGYLLANETTNSTLFYQLIPALDSTIDDPKPLILWLQGGPGCSSQYGSWIEFGPYYVEDRDGQLTPTRRNVTWSQYYHILLIDNPNNAGFSKAGSVNVTDTETSQIEVYNGLVQFFEIYPQLVNNPFYVFGESYGGHYLPYLAYEILTRGAKFNFSGIGIGNAWTDPYTQTTSFGEYSYAAGVIDLKFKQELVNLGVVAQDLILNGKLAEANDIFNQIENNLTMVSRTGGLFLNNYRSFLSANPADPIFNFYALTQAYLNSSEAKAMYNVSQDFNYNLCNGDINNAWAYDQSTSVNKQLEYVLSKTRVLIFSGADDIECNTAGVLTFIAKLNWAGIKDFKQAKRQIWRTSSGISGNAKTSTNLTFVTVYKAGHYVPFYQPQNSLDMVKRFIDNHNDWTTPYLH